MKVPLENELLYFESPEQAVDKIKKLLLTEDWQTLARYYNLSDSDIDLEQLRKGDYFIRKEEPEVKHPAANWRFKNPFDPAFEYHNYNESDNNIIQVTMRRQIEDGYDEPVVGLQFFEMIRKEKGYQVLP